MVIFKGVILNDDVVSEGTKVLAVSRGNMEQVGSYSGTLGRPLHFLKGSLDFINELWVGASIELLH